MSPEAYGVEEARQGPMKGEVAIIGMACVFPGAPNLDAYWQNIVSGVDAIIDVPADRWDPEVYFDPDSTADDRVYCKRGGYLGNLGRFNPMDFGIMPIVVDGGEPEQFLSLRVTHEALADAGYGEQPFNRERTQIILGRGNYSGRGAANADLHTLGIEEFLRLLHRLHPGYTAQELAALKNELKASLPRFGPDIASALIPNLTTGRIANRFDLMGANFTIDAACASALIAVDLGARDLLTGRCDLALVGGVHLATHVPFLAILCQLNALSRRSEIRPFDKEADGTLPGEGVGVVVLKRTEDAERDGDRIYALVKGIGIASDGRGQGLLAPRVEGEELALRRAYDIAGISPETIELIEAHGTATPVGDLAEIQALARVFGPRKKSLPTVAIGAVKSMIGHLMPAAGIAGLIKAALAVYHKVLPPTLHCDVPDPKFELEKTPLYINTETRPWIHGSRDRPRRAGVSAFGFGGINAHVVLEEHPSSLQIGGPRRPLAWETEVFIIQGGARQDLVEEARRLDRFLETTPGVNLKDLAFTLNTELEQGSLHLAVVASSVEDLRQKLALAGRRLAEPACPQIKDIRGVYYFEEPLRRSGKLAFLFPGEASQYPSMLRDLCLHFSEVREGFDILDSFFIKSARPFLPSQYIFPIPGPTERERTELEGRLWEMEGALAAISTANWALYTLLGRLEIHPDILLGHSSGEYSALVASGALAADAPFLERVVSLNSVADGSRGEGRVPEAVLAAVGADRRSVTTLLERVGGQATVSMDNCPNQVVIAGKEEHAERALQALRAEGVVCQRLPFNRAYHTSMFATAIQPLREFFRSVAISPPGIEVYSCSTMQPYPRNADEIRELVVNLWSRPVEFTGSIEALYDAGVRIFVEVGPRGNLAAFVEDILRGRPHLAMGCDVPQRSGVAQLNHLLGALAAHAVPMQLGYLYEGRSPRRRRLDEPGSTGDSGRKNASSLPLSLGLPVMRLSPDRCRAVGEASPTPQGPEVPALMDPWGEASRPSTEAVSQAMQEHLRTMERFLAIEQEVMENYLAGRGVAATPRLGPARVPEASAPPAFPFIGTITSLTPNQEVVVRQRIDPTEEIFLEDHCFGGQVSAVNDRLRPLPVMPFTMCMEILAETAALLVPGKLLIGMREVEIRQWIEAGSPLTIEISARMRSSGAELDVQMTSLGDNEGDEVPSTPVVKGTVIFADGYPPLPRIRPLALTTEQPCRHTAEQMYEQGIMFHGPRFRAVASLDTMGENGILGHLRVLPQSDLFRSTPSPSMILDPMLLDAAGQLLAYWFHDRKGYSMFPVRISSLEVYDSTPRVSDRVRCEVEVQELTSQRVRASMNFYRPDERLLMRLEGWEDWRILWAEKLRGFRRAVKVSHLSQSWETPITLFPGVTDIACRRLDLRPEHTRPIGMKALACLTLSEAERRQFQDLKGLPARKNEWLSARVAAKDAVRVLLKSRYGIDVFPADVEIDHDERGCPFARLHILEDSAEVPRVSLSHTDGVAVAVAGYCAEGQRLGIDIERVRPFEESFQVAAFSGEELGLLDSVSDLPRDEWVARLWCAKEAVGKALGRGLAQGPRSATVQALDPGTGRVEVLLGGGLAEQFPDLAGARLVVYTAREGDWLVASTLCEWSEASEAERRDDRG